MQNSLIFLRIYIITRLNSKKRIMLVGKVFAIIKAHLTAPINTEGFILNKKIFFVLSNPHWLFAIGVGLLALHPLIWLIKTWINPAYQSNGFLVVLLAGGLFLWSVTSRRDNRN